MVGVQKDKLHGQDIGSETRSPAQTMERCSSEALGGKKAIGPSFLENSADDMDAILEDLRESFQEAIQSNVQKLSRQVQTSVALETQRIMDSVSNQLKTNTTMLKHTLQMQIRMREELCEMQRRMGNVEQQTVKQHLDSLKKQPKAQRHNPAWHDFGSSSSKAESLELPQHSDSDSEVETTLSMHCESMELSEKLQGLRSTRGKAPKSSIGLGVVSHINAEACWLDRRTLQSPRLPATECPGSNKLPATNLPACRSKSAFTAPAKVQLPVDAPQCFPGPRAGAPQGIRAVAPQDLLRPPGEACHLTRPAQEVADVAVQSESVRRGFKKANKSTGVAHRKGELRSILRSKSQPILSQTSPPEEDQDVSCLRTSLHADRTAPTWHEPLYLNRQPEAMDPTSAVRASVNSQNLEVNTRSSDSPDPESSDSNPQDLPCIDSLFMAIERNDIHSCDRWLSNPEFHEINQVNDKSLTVLHKAALRGLPSVVSLILNHPKFTQANALMPGGLSALHCAAFHGFREICDMLLSHPNFSIAFHKDDAGLTALDHAERFGGSAAGRTALALRRYGLRRTP